MALALVSHKALCSSNLILAFYQDLNQKHWEDNPRKHPPKMKKRNKMHLRLYFTNIISVVLVLRAWHSVMENNFQVSEWVSDNVSFSFDFILEQGYPERCHSHYLLYCIALGFFYSFFSPQLPKNKDFTLKTNLDTPL